MHPASLHKNVPGVKVSTIRGKICQAGVMDLGGASEQSRPDRIFKLVKGLVNNPFDIFFEKSTNSHLRDQSLLETKQETVSYRPEEVLFQCESGWQMEQVASGSHWLYQCWCFQESSAKDTWCPDELLHGRTCILLAPWLHDCRFVSNRVALPGKKPTRIRVQSEFDSLINNLWYMYVNKPWHRSTYIFTLSVIISR